MQTFLPYKSFEESARCLDYRRLGKQRVEAKQIIDTIIAKSIRIQRYGFDKNAPKIPWENHPAVLMWDDGPAPLMLYYNIILKEWVRRGYNNNMCYMNVMSSDGKEFGINTPQNHVVMPRWLGNERFHASHRSNLLRKDKDYYSQFNWTEPDNLPYFWPTKRYIHEIHN